MAVIAKDSNQNNDDESANISAASNGNNQYIQIIK